MRNALLDRYQPLPRVLCADDFDGGFHGWHTLFPDYDGATDYPGRRPELSPLDQTLAASRSDPEMLVDRRIPLGIRGVPMLSTLTSWDTGSQGGWDGDYVLKIPTLARASDKGVATKRLACPWRGRARVETWFAYKADPCDFRLGETDVRSFILALDVVDPRAREPRRWWPAVRYLNAIGGMREGRWMLQESGARGVLDGEWSDFPGSVQLLSFDRSPTKYMWHYLRMTIDLGHHEYVDFHCDGRDFQVAGKAQALSPPLSPAAEGADHCAGLLAVLFAIEADSDKRCALYLDSVVVSVSE